MSDTLKATIETEGSRDEARRLLATALKKLLESAQEIEKLHQLKPKDVSYRRASAHIAGAIADVELARIEIRKRKIQKVDRVEVPNGERRDVVHVTNTL